MQHGGAEAVRLDLIRNFLVAPRECRALGNYRPIDEAMEEASSDLCPMARLPVRGYRNNADISLLKAVLRKRPWVIHKTPLPSQSSEGLRAPARRPDRTSNVRG